jgi:septum formation protein
MRLILASASPRRRELLAAAGFTFEVDAATVDETRRAGEDAVAYASRVALEKAQEVAARHADAAVLGADTIVLVGGEVLGKPADEDDARRMLRALSGRPHEVLTAVAIVKGGEVFAEVARTMVWMREISDQEIAAYVLSGEPMDKAGAYAIQGLASRFITRIDGEYANVVGLPVSVVDKFVGQL